MRKIVLILLSLVIISCDLFMPDDKDDKKDEKKEIPVVTPVLTQVEKLIKNYNEDLASSNILTNEQLIAITENVNVQLEEEKNKEEVEEIVPLITSAYITELSGVEGLSTEAKKSTINAVTENSIEIINKDFINSDPNNQPTKEEIKDVYDNLTTAVISSTAKAGLDNDSVLNINQQTIENLIESINETGATAADIEILVEVITEAALTEIITDESYDEIETESLNSISIGAITGVISIENDSVNTSDLIGSVTKVAVSSLENTEGTIEEKKELIGDITQSISQEISTNNPKLNQEEVIESIIEGAASGSQMISNEFNDIDTLIEVIEIVDNTGSIVDISDKTETIEEGINEGIEDKQNSADEITKEILTALNKDISVDNTTELQSDITVLTGLITKYPNNELIPEIHLKTAKVYRALKKYDNAIAYTTKAANNYNKTSWYAYEAILLQSDLYSEDKNEYNKAIESVNLIKTNFPTASDKLLRADYEIMKIYKNKLYEEFEWRNYDNESTLFIATTLIPAIEKVLESINNYTENQEWIINAAIQNKADAYLWLKNIVVAEHYLRDLIYTNKENNSITFTANLYYTLGNLYKNSVFEWYGNRAVNIGYAIENLIKAEELLYNNGNFVDKELYINTNLALLNSIQMEFNTSIETENENDRYFSAINSINIFDKYAPRVRNLGMDKDAQRAYIYSYVYELWLYYRVKSVFRRDSNYIVTTYTDRDQLYTIKIAEILDKINTEIDNYPLVNKQMVTDDIVFVKFGLLEDKNDFDNYYKYYNEIYAGLSNWSLAESTMNLVNYINNNLYSGIYDDTISLSSLESYLEIIKDIENKASNIVNENKKFYWYTSWLKDSFGKFYYIYFTEKSERTEKPAAYTNESLINARIKSVEYYAQYLSIGGYWPSIANLDKLLSEESQKYGDAITIDEQGDINVTIQ